MHATLFILLVILFNVSLYMYLFVFVRIVCNVTHGDAHKGIIVSCKHLPCRHVGNTVARLSISRTALRTMTGFLLRFSNSSRIRCFNISTIANSKNFTLRVTPYMAVIQGNTLLAKKRHVLLIVFAWGKLGDSRF